MANASSLNRLETKAKKRQIFIEYLQKEASIGHYPTYNELSELFHINLRTVFPSIIDAYHQAGVAYVRDPNPFIKYEKERKLTVISVKLFRKMGYKIERISIGPSTKGGPDILIRNPGGSIIPVEIKGYHKFGSIGGYGHHTPYSHYFGMEMEQLLSYMSAYSAKTGYLVTSTDRNNLCNPDPRVKIFFSNDLRHLLIRYGMHDELKNLEWVRNTYTSYSKRSRIELTKNRIKKYCKMALAQGKYTSRRTLQGALRINLKSYFGSMKDVYAEIGVDANSLPNHRMGGQADKSVMKDRILVYVKSMSKKGIKATYKEIQRTFGCLPKLYFPGGIREIYDRAGVQYDRIAVSKTPEERRAIRSRILSYIRENASKGKHIGWTEINKELRVGLGNYFKTLNDAYRAAGVTLE